MTISRCLLKICGCYLYRRKQYPYWLRRFLYKEARHGTDAVRLSAGGSFWRHTVLLFRI